MASRHREAAFAPAALASSTLYSFSCPRAPSPSSIAASLVRGAAGVPPAGAIRTTAAHRAEFVLAAGDSSFWVTSMNGSVHVRGAPLDVARVEGRLYELYVTDDDRSFGDAVLVGQHVYRRDLITDDSLLVYQDTIVPRVARLYARLHPDDAPVALRQTRRATIPLWTATATLDLDEVTALSSLIACTPTWSATMRPSGTPVVAVCSTCVTAAAPRWRAWPADPTPTSERAPGRTSCAPRSIPSARARTIGSTAPLHALSHYRLDPASFSLTTSRRPAVSLRADRKARGRRPSARAAAHPHRGAGVVDGSRADAPRGLLGRAPRRLAAGSLRRGWTQSPRARTSRANGPAPPSAAEATRAPD